MANKGFSIEDLYKKRGINISDSSKAIIGWEGNTSKYAGMTPQSGSTNSSNATSTTDSGFSVADLYAKRGLTPSTASLSALSSGEGAIGSYNSKISDASNRYNQLVNRLNSAIGEYGVGYGNQRSNRSVFYKSLKEFDDIKAEIDALLVDVDSYNLYATREKELKDAINELLETANSASLDARSRIAAYNNPATQRIMQMEDEQLFTAKQFENYERALQSIPNRLTTQALTDAPYEYSGLGSSAARAKLAEMPEGNAKNAVGAWLQSPVGQAISDEAISKEIERLKAIDIDTAISTVQQTIDEKDAKVQTMSKYWDEQAWMNDENAEAPDHEEYQRELAELEKYQLILDRLYADKDAERAGGFRMTDDSIARSHLSENYNATNLYDRVNKAFFDTTVDFGVEYTPPEGVKTSSYPIAQRPENYMTQDERDTFNKLWHYEGEESANAYFDRLKPTLEARGAQQVMAEAKQFTEDYPNWAWVQARGANAMKPISSAFMVGDIIGGEGVRENSAANMNTKAANFVDSYVPEVTNYTGNTKFLGRDLDQFLYGTVGSTVDSAVRMMTASFIGGSGAGASLKENAQGIARATGALMSLEVFPSVVLEEKEKGRSDTQAVLLGAVRAAIEGFTEKYSVELLFSPSKTIGGFLLKGAAAEGSEEIAATVLNGVVDIIAADRDNILQEWDRRTALGIDPIEALADILVERGESTLADGMSGALSGLLFSAGGAASGAMTPTTQSAERMAQSAEVTDALVKQALAENPNNRVALKAQEDLAAGKTISAKTVQKLIESNESVYRKDDQQTIASFVASELTNRGEVTAVNETANAIAKAVVGENLSDGDLRAIENSVFGKQLYNEVTGQTKGGEWLNQLRDNLDVVEIARPQIQRETKPTAAKRVTVKNADATTKDGTAVQIVGLEAQTDGTTKVKVKGSDGAVKVMAASELELNEISKDLIEGVAKFKGAAPAIYAAYMPTNDVGTYLNDVEYIVTAANGVAADNDGSTILDYLKNSKHISDLADVQIETIFNAALAEGRKALAEAQPLSTSGSGQFTYTAKRAESSLKGREAAATVFMQNLAKAFPNIDIEVFESTARMGKYIGEQGSYSDGKIRIDLNAGKNFTYDVAESAMLRTLSHELTHHLQRTAPKQYADLKAFVIKHLAEWNGGTELDDLISAKQRRSGGKLSYAAALDEVVADSCEMMLKNSAAVKQLAVENKGLFSKIRDFVKKFLSDLRRAFAGVEANDAAARYLKKFESEMQKLWDEAFTASVQNARSAVTEKMGVAVDMETESVTPTAFSERTWHSSDYVQSRDKAAAEIASAIDVSPQQAKDYIDDINSIARMISEDRTRLDYFSSPMRSSFISNAEYGGSFDFSTLCKKRRLLTGTFTAIQKALPNTALTANEILEIRNKMKEAGLEVSCGLCYVEGSRANMGQFAKEFLRLYKQYYPEAWQPNMADVNTPDGIEWVRINHPECYEQYEYFWNHYGTLKAGDKNLFASQQKPKLYQLHTEYNGEILVHFKGDAKIEEKNKNGGVRLQSFSDFEIVHLIDCMQIIMDMSRVGLAGQAYTKVPEFAWALGDTGLKINLSLIAKDVDANGKLIFDDVEGMPINTAMELRNRYSANVGTILVVFNDAQLTAAMADERVDFIIPFHRSQWKKSQYAAMGLPANTKDYTYQQNEKYIKPQFHEYRGRMVRDKATNYMPNEYWDFTKSGKENAEAYLEMCAANNKRPKFYRLLKNNGDGSYSLKEDGSTDGYWKLLIDFKMYDNEGNGSPQMPVQPKFNMEQATKMLNEYKGGHSQFPVAQGIVDEFVSNYKSAHEGTQFSERDYEAAEIARLEQRIAALEQGKSDAFLAGQMRTARQAGKETRRLTEKIDTLKGKLEEAKQTAKDTKKATAEDRKAATLRAKNLEAQIEKVRKEAAAEGFLAGQMSVAQQAGKEVRSREEVIAELKQELAEKKESYKQQMSDYRAGRKRTLTIESIKRAEKNLQNQLLGKGGKGAYVPTNLVKSAIAVAQLINTAGNETYTRNGKVVESKAFKDYVSVKDALRDLQEEYNQLPQNPDPEYAQEYSREFEEMLQELRKTIGDKNVRQLTNDELEDVNMILRQLGATLADAKMQIGKLDALTNYEVAERIWDEMNAVRRVEGKKMREIGNKLDLEILSPLRNINRMVGYVENSALRDLFNDLNDGIKKQNAFRMDANKYFDQLRTEKTDRKLFAEAVNDRKEFDIKDVNGRNVSMSMMQAMQLILSYEREASNKKTSHLENGGAIIPNEELLRKGKVADAILQGTIIPRVTLTDINNVRKDVNKFGNGYGKRFMQASKYFFNTISKDAVNDTTMKTKHIPVATEKDYIPFTVDPGSTDSVLEGLKYDHTIEGSGLLKSVRPNASNALVIVGLNSVIEQHIEEVAKIYGLTIPIRNFDKVWNVKKIGSQMTTKKAVGYAWLSAGQKMIEQTLADLQSSRKTAQGDAAKVLNEIRGNFVKKTLLTNLSVTIKQAASYSVAGLHLSQRALAPYQTRVVDLFVRPNSKFAQDLYEEIDTYTPEHWIRRQGMSSQEVGDFAMKDNWLTEVDHILPASANPLKWIQGMDVATTGALWLAAKKQVELDGKYEKGTDEYWTAVTKLYEDTIEETQPMYDVLHRPEMQKTTSDLVKSIFMFKTQPLQNTGIIYDSYGEMVAMRDAAKSGKVSQEKAKASTKKFVTAVATQIASLSVFATMSLVARAALHKMKRYRDDDDELTVESVLKRMGLDMLSSAAGIMMPFGGTEAFEFIDSVFGQNMKWNDSFSVPTVQMLNDFVESVGNAAIAAWDSANGEGDAKKLLTALKNLGYETSGLLAGFPAQNIENILVGAIDNIRDIVNGKVPSFNNDVERTNGTNYRRMLNAVIDNDAAKYDEVYNEVYAKLTGESNKTEKDARADIQTGFAEAVEKMFIDGDITEEDARKYLAEYAGRNDGAIDLSIVKWKIATNKSEEKAISKALAAGEITSDEAVKQLSALGIDPAVAYEAVMDSIGRSKYFELDEAMKNDADIKGMLDRLVGYGIDEKNITDRVKENIKAMYLGTEDMAATIDAATAEKMLVDYASVDANDAHFTVKGYGVENFSKYDAVRDAILNGGDVDAAIAELIEYGTRESDVRENIRSSIRAWYQGEDKDDGARVEPIIDSAKAIELLVQYGDKKQEDAEKLVTEWSMQLETGMGEDDLRDAFLSGELSTDEAIEMRMIYFGQTEENATQTVANWVFAEEYGFSYTDRNEHFRDGEISASEMIDIEMEYGGKSREDAQKSLVSKVMDGYKDGSFSESEAMSMLTTNGGLTSDEATKKIRYADAVAAYPDADIDDAWVDEYYAEVESSGISFNTFIDYRTSVKDIKGEGKKENRMAVIDSLPISNAQKDALYYAEGWAASTIHEAPWH